MPIYEKPTKELMREFATERLTPGIAPGLVSGGQVRTYPPSLNDSKLRHRESRG